MFDGNANFITKQLLTIVNHNLITIPVFNNSNLKTSIQVTTHGRFTATLFVEMYMVRPSRILRIIMITFSGRLQEDTIICTFEIQLFAYPKIKTE